MPDEGKAGYGLQSAAEFWRAGPALEAGRLLLEHLPTALQPAWAANILRLVLDKSGVDRCHFDQILYTADHRNQWANGHRAFDILRDLTLELLELQKARQLTNEEIELYAVVSLAEFVAKVTYNAVDPPDPFDEDSGWWIADSLRGFVNDCKDEKFTGGCGEGGVVTVYTDPCQAGG